MHIIQVAVGLSTHAFGLCVKAWHSTQEPYAWQMETHARHESDITQNYKIIWLDGHLSSIQMQGNPDPKIFWQVERLRCVGTEVWKRSRGK